MPNRLADETSPYLLQHKDNPVDWFPWGDEAFEKATTEGKAVFLSVGYSSCHWCHVMEHESFEDQEIADLLNDKFVSVKVDREERPDIDEVYMTAVQLSSGRGGWPMTVFLTPDRRPFFAASYFPKEDRGKMPGLKTILTQISKGWAQERAKFEEVAKEFANAIKETVGREAPKTFTKLGTKLVDDAVRTIGADFDTTHAGFGTAPKFPPHTSIEFLLSYGARGGGQEDLVRNAIAMGLSTLEQMALGGIHDHVGGGFHRYSTDEKWVLPHFEKMLYDNALLLSNYAFAARLVMQMDQRLAALFVRAAAGIVEWLDREMTAPEGYFCSAQDADTEGEEGKYYVWTVGEIRAVLGERAQAFIDRYQITEQGNFEDEASGQKTGASIPFLLNDDIGEFEQELEQLLIARQIRVKPGLDDKVIVGWNGLMIAGLAEAGELQRAHSAARAILAIEKELGHLPHQIVQGKPSGHGYLDDYAAFTYGLMVLAEMEDPESPAGQEWIQNAQRLGMELARLFLDEEKGGFFATSDAHEDLFGRSKPVFDQPIPSGNSLALRCMLRLGAHEVVAESLEGFVGWMEKAPQATEGLLIAAMELFQLTQVEGEVASESPSKPVNAEITVRLSAREIVTDSSGKALVDLHLSIPEGFHINSNSPPARWLIPTTVEVQPVAAKIIFPEATNDQYSGNLVIPIQMELPAGEKAAEFEVKVGFQACTDSECLPPVEKSIDAVLLRG